MLGEIQDFPLARLDLATFFFHSSGCGFHFRGLAGIELTPELEFTGNSNTSSDAIFFADQHKDASMRMRSRVAFEFNL